MKSTKYSSNPYFSCVEFTFISSNSLHICKHFVHAVVLSPVGRLDSDGASLLLTRIIGAIENADARVVLDCAGMSYVNSTGLRALLIGAKECRQAGGNLVVAALASQCRSVMEMSGFLTVIDYREAPEAALAALARD